MDAPRGMSNGNFEAVITIYDCDLNVTANRILDSDALFQTYPEFSSASEVAKRLACHFKESVGVERAGDGWDIVMSDRIKSALAESLNRDVAEVEADLKAERRAEEADAVYFEEHDGKSPEAEIYEKERAELAAELSDDLDDYARSEEDGWMYPD
jgi:hypothetical protein